MIEGPELSLSGPQDFLNRFVPSLPPASCFLPPIWTQAPPEPCAPDHGPHPGRSSS